MHNKPFSFFSSRLAFSLGLGSACSTARALRGSCGGGGQGSWCCTKYNEKIRKNHKRLRFTGETTSSGGGERTRRCTRMRGTRAPEAAAGVAAALLL